MFVRSSSWERGTGGRRNPLATIGIALLRGGSGPAVDGVGRQDVLREPWFLGTVLGCVGGLLWLGLCIVSVWLYRRRKAVTGRKLKNLAAYSGTTVQHTLPPSLFLP